MGKQNKVSGKVKKDPNNDRKYTIETDAAGEVDIEIELLEDGAYVVDKLQTESLPKKMPDPDSTTIRWLNNFSIQENRQNIKKKYNVRIPGLASKLREKNSRLVIYSDMQTPNLYYYQGTVQNDTFELSDGDPGVGMGP